MKFSMPFKLLSLTSLMIMSGLCVAKDDIPEVTLDGLHLLKDTKLTRVYTFPGIDLGKYNRVNLDETYVAFKRNWQPNRNEPGTDKISAEDMAKIKIELSSLFRDVFSRTLEAGGYELVTERAEDVLLIKPAIINLGITTLDAASGSRIRSYSESAGEMTLYLELYDSVTDDIIAKAIDRQKDRQTGYFKWQNRVSNRAAATRILQVWANVLKEGLDEARFRFKSDNPSELPH